MKVPLAEDPRYSVDAWGFVYGLNNRPLVQQTNGLYGYRKVSLGRGRQRYVHRLVAAAFLGAASGREVDHINGDVADNRVVNLRYLTHSENMAARQVQITRCKRGHLYELAVGWYAGRRICLECRRMRDRERRPSKARIEARQQRGET